MFKDKDVICFFGDSITASGLWEAEVYQALKKKHKIKCYTMGVPGGTAKRSLEYLYEECLIYNPDYVVLMFGMNDFGKYLYTKEWADKEETPNERQRLINVHKESYEQIIKNCKEAGSEVIICLTTPHDEVSEFESDKVPYQQALETGAKFHLEMAEKYNCRIVNFKDNMMPLLGKREIIRQDRVHPTPEGYHVMAQIFLKETGEIEEMDFDTPFVFEDWNKERFDAEQKNHNLNYVEFNRLLNEGYMQNKTADEVKELAKQMYEEYEDKTAYGPTALADYIENGHMRIKNKAEIVRLTTF